MSDETGRVWLTYNGEMYGFRSRRAELEKRGVRFRSTTDSEVLIHLYKEFGPDFVEHVDGMFALALWDADRQTLILARDRLGVKPLYYTRLGGSLLFASELKALLAHPGLTARVDYTALDRYFSFLTVPGRRSIVREVFRLEPGTRLVIRDAEIRQQRFWDLQPPEAWLDGSEEDLSDVLDRRLGETVGACMVSDAPVGIFLSGGLDSSTVAYWAAQNSEAPLHSYTIALRSEPSNDESAVARSLAGRCGFQHHEVELENSELPGILREMVWHADEPFAIGSALALFVLSRAARERIKVVLSGDGGDEVFGGYLWRHASNGTADEYLRKVLYVDPAWKRELFTEEFRQATGAEDAGGEFRAVYDHYAGAGALWKKLYTDLKTTLVDEMLTKTDRMTMAHGIEARVPLLEYRLVDWAMRLPAQMKVSGGRGKVILRRLAASYFGPELAARKKLGLNVPLNAWLRGPLQPLLDQTLSAEWLRGQDYFNEHGIQSLLARHRSGEDRGPNVFALLCYALWREAFPEVRS